MTPNKSWRIIAILMVLLLSTGLQNSTVSLPNSIWSATEVVSTESTLNSYRPSLATDSQNNVHVVWHDYTDYAGSGTDADIFYKFWNSTSQSWNTTGVVSTESTDHSYNPRLAIDSLGNVHVVWYDATDYLSSGTDNDIFYKFWNVTSQSWSTTELISTESTLTSEYPRLSTDSLGNVHVVWFDYTDYLGSDNDPDIFYRLWNSTSQSWNTTGVVSTESTEGSLAPSLAIDSQDNIHVVWYDNTDYLSSGIDADISYKFWNSTSQSWSTTEMVSTESTGASWGPNLAIDGKDNVHVAWDDFTDYLGSGTDRDIFYRFRNAATQSWYTTQVVSTESTEISEKPSIVINSQNNVHVVWQDSTDYLGSGTDIDIFSKLRNSTSQSWSTTEVVSTESTSFSQYSRLAIDSEDNVHVMWQDYTPDYAGSDTDGDIFYKIGYNTNSFWQTVTNTETSTVTSTETETETESSTVNNTETETSTVTNIETVTGPIETITETAPAPLVTVLFAIISFSKFRKKR